MIRFRQNGLPVGPMHISKFSSIKPKKIADEIVEQLKSLIFEGNLNPGEKLPPERDLAKALNVSRASLREALNKLQAMGLLEIQRGNCTFIRPVTTRSIDDPLVSFIKSSRSNILKVFELRKYLEIDAVFLAAERATNDEIKKLSRNLKTMEKDLKQNHLGANADSNFHHNIVIATHNLIYVHIMNTIYDLLQEELRITWGRVFYNNEAREELFQQHKNIYKAIKEHNPKKGWEAAYIHMSFVQENWRRNIAQGNFHND